MILVLASRLSGTLVLSTAPVLPTRTMPKLGANDGAGNTLLMLVTPSPPPGTGAVGPSPFGPRSVMA
ncbi:hypothetical protein D3C72_1766350 [compost metagenome]